MAAGAAVFLIFSFWMMVSINSRYFERQDEARKVWTATLSTVLTPAEIDEFSEQPIRRSIGDYRAARLCVGLFYAVLVGVLALFAWASLTVRAVAPAGHTAKAPAAIVGTGNVEATTGTDSGLTEHEQAKASTK